MEASDSSKVFVFYLKGEPSGPKPGNPDQPSKETTNQSTNENLPGSSRSHCNSIAGKIESMCRCSKSRCLRLKCSCFVNGQVCGPKCDCRNCLNSVSNQTLIDAAVNLNKKIFNNAFRKAQVHEVNGKRILDSGCRCKLSGCRNSYCQCVRNGATCSDLCGCKVCDHEKVTVEVKLTEKLPHKNRRKRLRLVIKKPRQENEPNELSEEYLLLEKI